MDRFMAVASQDSTTATLTRAAWTARAEHQLAASAQLHHVAVLIIDVDHFKQINDAHDHLTGDQVIAAVAHTVRTEIRHVDLIGRFGGDEFVVLLTGEQTERSLTAIAERIRSAVTRLRVPVHATDGPITISGLNVSLGAALRPCSSPLRSLLEAADRALYRAKAAGRDAVAVDTSPPSDPDQAQHPPRHRT